MNPLADASRIGQCVATTVDAPAHRKLRTSPTISFDASALPRLVSHSHFGSTASSVIVRQLGWWPQVVEYIQASWTADGKCFRAEPCAGTDVVVNTHQ